MKSRIPALLSILLVVTVAGCGSGSHPGAPIPVVQNNTTILSAIPVPSASAARPFDSFDESWVDPVNHKLYVSNRVDLGVDVFDSVQNRVFNTPLTNIVGENSVVGVLGANSASACVGSIPPLQTAVGHFTQFGCRTGGFTLPGGIGADGLFGGFPGAQCCTASGGTVEALSCPCAVVASADGNTLFVGNASSTVVVFSFPKPFSTPTVVADVPTGQSPDWDGPSGIALCLASGNGRHFRDSSCGDLRAGDMAYDEKDKILLVTNGDPFMPFVTLIDMSAVVAGTGNCLPVNPAMPYGPGNFPTCILGQIYYDGAPANNVGVAVDDQSGAGFPCPDPSTNAPSGVSGSGAGAGGKNVPCHHGPILPGFGGALTFAGLGGAAFNPSSGHFLLANRNPTSDPTVGTVDEIDPRIGNPNGPVVINSFPLSKCVPTSIVQGPGTNFLVGCAGNDGTSFAPIEVVINGDTGATVATINGIGGVDQVWFNPGDMRYYVAAFNMTGGSVLGIIDANANKLVESLPTNPNSHSVAVDSSNNHVFVPMAPGPFCLDQSSIGCIAFIGQSQ